MCILGAVRLGGCCKDGWEKVDLAAGFASWDSLKKKNITVVVFTVAMTNKVV